MWRKQRSLFSQCSTLEQQNVFWGKSCKYSFKSISLVWLVVTFRLLIQCYNPTPAITKASSDGSEEGHAQDGLRQYLPCSPRMAMSDVDLWLGRYLTARSGAALRATDAILHAALWFHKNNSQQLEVLPEHWGMSSPPPSPRLAADFCPHQTPAAIIPTPSLQLVSEHSWAEGIPSVIFLFPVQHPTKQALWMPLMTVSGLEGWIPNNFFPMTPTS